MAFSTAISTLFIATAFAAANDSLDPLSDEFISQINSKQDFWVAGRNFPVGTPLSYIEGLMRPWQDSQSQELSGKVNEADPKVSLPEYFDAREKWPNCPSLNEIRDQGSCGSCWALGAVIVMTDLVCTYSNGTKQFHFSAQDLVSCCKQCGSGCSGGNPFKAFEYWRDVGIVSGGPYNSSEGCMPYEIPPCQHADTKGPRPKCLGIDELVVTPKCLKTCKANYNVDYYKDRLRAKSIRYLSGEENIKEEVYKNGPVEASFKVFYDFPHYKSGVYERTTGNDTHRSHDVKILGWGVENGKKYWLCANSWNIDWGDKGFLKFLRGENHCGIETDVITGEPDLHALNTGIFKVLETS